MLDFKKILFSLLYPPIFLIVILVLLSGGGMAYTVTVFGSEHLLTYIVYALSAYTLTVVCFRIPNMIRFCKRFKQDNRYARRYFTDAHLRVKLSLYSALLANTAYGLLQLGMGFWHRSVWFYSLAAYYVLLGIMRFLLLKDVRADNIGEDVDREYRRYRFCGIVLSLMNMVLAGIVLYITRFGYGFEHHYITTIALAAYTFGSMVMAIMNVVKYRKYNSPVYSASKAISLTSALVSMLTLETAMLSSFGEADGEEFRRIMTGTTGGVVCAFVLGLGIYMIVRSTIALQRRDKTNE